MKSRLSVLALATSALATSYAAYAAAPEGFTTICTLDESCAVESSTLVAFNNNGKFSYRTLSGNFICNGKTFRVAGKPAANSTCMTLDPAINSVASSSSSGTVQDVAEADAKVPSGVYAIVSRSSGKALAIADGSTGDGALLVQQDFIEDPHQLWQLEDLGNGYYSLTAYHSAKALEIQDFSNRDGIKVLQQPWINGWDQHWSLQKLNGGFYRISARHSSQVLDVYELNKKHGGPVSLWTYWGGENQQWRLLPIEVAQATTAEPAQLSPTP